MKPLTEFYTRKRKYGTYYEPTCKICMCKIAKKYRAKKDRRPSERKYALKKKFNMTVDEFNTMLQTQDGKCKICRWEEWLADGRSLAVDHDPSCCSGQYSCGKCIRGVLCNRCNITLGKVGDDIVLLLLMAKYLSDYRDNNWLSGELDGLLGEINGLE